MKSQRLRGASLVLVLVLSLTLAPQVLATPGTDSGFHWTAWIQGLWELVFDTPDHRATDDSRPELHLDLEVPSASVEVLPLAAASEDTGEGSGEVGPGMDVDG